jgi:hypothetical protein
MTKYAKRILSFTLFTLLITFSVGCASNSSNQLQSKSASNGAAKVNVEELARKRAEAESKAAALAAKAKGNQASIANKAPQNASSETQPANKVDIDLTVLSPQMLLAEVQNIGEKYYEYEDKVIKINGRFNSFVYEGNNKRYYQCVLSDACCSFDQGVGLEFEWAGNHTYPEDYPDIQDPITVTGRFTVYEEDGKMYATLASSEVVF